MAAVNNNNSYARAHNAPADALWRSTVKPMFDDKMADWGKFDNITLSKLERRQLHSSYDPVLSTCGKQPSHQPDQKGPVFQWHSQECPDEDNSKIQGEVWRANWQSSSLVSRGFHISMEENPGEWKEPHTHGRRQGGRVVQELLSHTQAAFQARNFVSRRWLHRSTAAEGC